MPNQNSKLAYGLLVLVITMLGLSFMAVPFYDWFCRVTGFGGTPQIAKSDNATILDQIIQVRFDASLEAGMPWEFKPLNNKMQLKIGETVLAFYEAYNPTNQVIAGQASYNVFPYAAGAYFNKIECFCFQMQILQPKQRIKMPVTFFVDPEIINDTDVNFAESITLSYTFHKIKASREAMELLPVTAIID